MLTVDQAKARWRGVVAPLVTPFTADGRVDLDALRTNLKWLLAKGARPGNTVLLAAGAGGDFPVMNLAERTEVIETVAEVTDGYLPIIASAQSLDIRESISLCELCESLHIDGVQISGPFYHAGHAADVFAWLSEVSRNTDINFVLYNNWYTGYDMQTDFIEAVLDSIPNAVGVKWAAPTSTVEIEGICRLAPRAAVINNTHQIVAGHILGCTAFVSHFPNFYPEFCWRIWKLMADAGDYRQAQLEFFEVMMPYLAIVGSVARETAGEGVFVRPAMAAVGLDGGQSRLPSRDEVVTPEVRTALERLIHGWLAQTGSDPDGDHSSAEERDG